MLQAAVRGREGFEVSAVEDSLPRPSYTVNTIRALSGQEEAELYFLVGWDSFKQIQKWTGYREIFDLAGLAVFRRPGTPGQREDLGSLLAAILGREPAWDEETEAYVPAGGRPIHYFEGRRLDISSTVLRRSLAQGESIRWLVPEEVRLYIAGHDLYNPKTRGADE
jgi:nicotinate-nucleotide adenylyltransferase